MTLGNSYTYEKPVLEVISSRFPVSLTFGLTGLFFTYIVCIPLGIKKALEHDRPFDHWSSVLIFLGYSVPSFALAIVLIVLFGGGSFWNIFPISGMVSDNFEELSLLAKLFDYAKTYVFTDPLLFNWWVCYFDTSDEELINGTVKPRLYPYSIS